MAARTRPPGDGGFTLLEVLVAFAILAIAVVTLIQLCSQGLRLLKVSGDHQQAVLLADRIARETDITTDDDSTSTTKPESVDTGEEGNFTWERRITRLELPEELEPKQNLPGKEVPGLYTISVAVRWGQNHSVEVATLRSPSGTSPTPTVDQTATQTDQTTPQGGAPRTPGQSTQGTTGSSRTPFGGSSGSGSSSSGSSSSSGMRPSTR